MLILVLFATAFLAWFIGWPIVATVLTVIAIGALEVFLIYIEGDSAIKRFFLRWRWVVAGVGLYMAAQTIVGKPADWNYWSGLLHGGLLIIGLGFGYRLLPPQGAGKGWQLLAVATFAIVGVAMQHLGVVNVNSLPGVDVAGGLLKSVSRQTSISTEGMEMVVVANEAVFYADNNGTPLKPTEPEAVVKLLAGEKLKQLSKAQEFKGSRFIKVGRLDPVTGEHFDGPVGWVLVSAIETPEPARHVANKDESKDSVVVNFGAGETIFTGLIVKEGDWYLIEPDVPVKTESPEEPSGFRIINKPTKQYCLGGGQLTLYAGDKGGTVKVTIL